MEESVKPVSISAPGGEKTETKLEPAGPGIWKSTIEVKLPGLYKADTDAESGPLAAVAHAGAEDPREMSEVTASEEKLKPLVEATGGGIFWTGTAGREATQVDVPRVTMLSDAKVLAGSGWMGLKDRQAYLTKGVKLTPLFTGLLALTALLALLAAAWWREGK
jgi:hypothetical protein